MIFGWIIPLITGGLAGWIAGKLMNSDGSVLRNILLGLIGGVVGVLGNPKESPCVLLRADVDALEIKEKAENLKRPRSCISKNDGAMHACGHDAHTAMLLGAAQILKNHEKELGGRVRLLCQINEKSDTVEQRRQIHDLQQYFRSNGKYSADQAEPYGA